MLHRDTRPADADAKAAAFSNRLSLVVRNVSLTLLACCVLAVVFVAPFVQYASKHYYLAEWNLILVPAALVAIAGIAFVIRRWPASAQPHRSRIFETFVAAATATTLVLQGLIVSGAWFVTDWDCGTIAMNDPADIVDYLSVYPNQLFLVGLFSWMRQAAALFGIEPYLVMVYGGCISVTVSACLASFVARKLFGKRAAIVASTVLFVFCGLSPWILVPYSDTYGMLAPTAILFAYVCMKDARTKTAVIAAAFGIGYCIKPTTIFAVLAILCIEGCRLIHRLATDRASLSLKRGIMGVGAAALGGLLAFSLVAAAEKDLPELDENRAYSAAHYLMLGLNAQTYGVWSQSDVEYSSSFATPEERRAGNIEEWKNRVHELGIDGAAKLYAKKVIRSYSDGAFAWEEAGTFYADVRGENDVMKAWWGIGDKGDNVAFRVASQIVWFAVLIGMVLLLSSRKSTRAEAVMAFALVMLTCFLAVFECNARYLFLYLPYYIVLASGGWLAASRLLPRKDAKRR